MSAEVALLVPGAVLVLAAALGRRPLSLTARASIAFAGALFLSAGLILAATDAGDPRGGPIRTTIVAELAPDEVSEEVRVFLDGRDAGVLRVDERTPKATLNVTVASVGRHGYRLESTRQVKGRRLERASRESQVVVDGERPLAIVYSLDGKVYLTAF